MRTHSLLRIRDCDTLSMGVLNLPLGLSINLPGYISSHVSPGCYSLSERLCGFHKERGEIIVDGLIYHIEIISVIGNGGNRSPLLIRLWNTNTYDGYEYLFSDNAIIFRCKLLKGQIVTDTLIMQLAIYLSDNYHSEYVPDTTQIVIGIHDHPFLIPNLSVNEHCQRLNSLNPAPSAESALEELITLFYGDNFNPNNLIQLIGLVDNKIPHTIKDRYVHGGTFLNKSTENVITTITDINQYAGITCLSRIVFDHFVIEVDLNNQCTVKLIQLDSMSAPYLSISCDKAHDIINQICTEFLYLYFKSVHNGDNIRYVDVVDNVSYPIDKLIISRTMDEYVNITLYSGDMMYEKTYDLIILSIMSPVMKG